MRLIAGNAASLSFDERPGGILLWYDYHVNNPWNPDVRAVTASELARLFPRM